MHPEIRQFPSVMFYQGKLIDAPSITAELARTLSSNNNNNSNSNNSNNNNNNHSNNSYSNYNNHHNNYHNNSKSSSTTDVSMDVATDESRDVATDVSMGVSVDHSTTHLLHPPHSAPCQGLPPSEPPTTPRFGGMRAFPRTTTASTTTTTTTTISTMTSFSHPHQLTTITPALIPTAVTATSTTGAWCCWASCAATWSSPWHCSQSRHCLKSRHSSCECSALCVLNELRSSTWYVLY